MKKLRTAVVGLGRIGWGFHIPAIISHGDRFSLTAVVDVSEERLAEAAQKYGVPGYQDLEEMIRAEKPEVVVIASPTHLHREHACTAMRLGVDVFLDKPMAPDYETACAIARCAEETGRKLMVFQPHRAKAPVNHLREIIASGKLGRIVSVSVANSGYVRRSDWQAFRKYGGGMLNNYGAHYIDAAIYLIQDKVRRLFCAKDIAASAGDADDVVKILFRTQGGITVDIDINQAAALPKPEWTVYGTCGAVVSEKSPEGKRQFRLRWFDPREIPEITASETLAAANRSYNNDVRIPWVTEEIPEDPGCGVDFYEKLYEYVAEDKDPYVPVEETLYVMELIRRCHEDADQ